MNKKRVMSYLVLLSLFVVIVVGKAYLVTKERQREVVTVPAIWQGKGKPVVTMQVKRGDVEQFSKVVASPLSEGGFICYVPADQRRLLTQGQVVASSEGSGLVVDVEQKVDIATGLYPVHLQMEGDKGGVAEIKTSTIVDALFVPKEAVRLEEGNHFSWVVENNRVQKRFVDLGRTTRLQVEVITGLKDDDTIILEGGALLKEGDLINEEVVR